ncbi:NAD(P)-binding protein [Rhodoferax sp.]|uniref:NAD(P)/FAD-dependent oxidoreductase n=1 Tax=Rhodoferax sp. TaxID=50421 RepID=UPI0025FF8771|nr:NAD(P)-binding protein [Rhodoferax sp.]MCM2295833.1 NAD(P)-binding protein [Rhodoferax sp.]
MKVAIVGSGISGLAAAHALSGRAEVSLFEAGSYFGGHTHTVDVTLPTRQGLVTHGVDTGFLVLNERTYPNLLKLFAELCVVTAKSDMSFSVQAFDPIHVRALEWSGCNLNTVFAQRSNLVNGRFWGMLRDLLRFNALTTRMAHSGTEAELTQPLGDFLREHRFDSAFCDWYFLPMMACIWSCPTAQMLQFPVATMVRFCHNHGLLQITNRPQWWTVQGGARQYVEKITAGIQNKHLNSPVRCIESVSATPTQQTGVRISTDAGQAYFDKLIIATHANQALEMLAAPTSLEHDTLGAMRTQPNRAVLHTDVSVLPKRQAAWAAWNYERAPATVNENARVCLHYLINRLQPLPWQQPVLVSLNPARAIDPANILGEYDYAHPVFDQAAVAAQGRMHLLQGQQHRYYAGAWMGYGFHEDGLKAGLAAAKKLLADVASQEALA